MYVGAHVSAAGGIDNAVQRAVEIGAEAIQTFPSSPRAWRWKPLADENVEKFRAAADEAGLGPTVFHAIYLVALGSSDEALVERSVESLANYMEAAEQLGAAGVIFHPASHKGAGYEAVEGQIVKAIHRVLDASPGEAWLALETSAGMGDHIGSKFEEMGALVKAIDHPRIRVCLDTQHVWAAGYDIATADGMNETIGQFDEHIGLDLLTAIHANDSKTPNGSAVDRHENLGEGSIGLDGFRTVLSHDALRDVPLYLEVPGFEGGGPDEENVSRLKGIREELGLAAPIR